MEACEIDKKIATDIMGWEYSSESLGKTIFVDPALRGRRGKNWRKNWQPSTNIAHAFEARDKIATMSTSVRIRFARSLVDVISDRVEKRISPEMVMLYVEPVDISLAALEAVKGKDDGTV